MMELKKIYQRTSLQTQNRLQEIFDGINFDFTDLYSIADIKTKQKINTYIEEWQDKGLLTGYFGMLAKNIKNRSRVKNSEILELLIYGAYIEEQDKLDNKEQQIMYEDANFYYQEAQKEVVKNKGPSILEEALFLYLMTQPNYSGFNWEQYIETAIRYNTSQIYKQAIINLQQQKELKINSDEFKRIVSQQNNQKLNINGDKISRCY